MPEYSQKLKDQETTELARHHMALNMPKQEIVIDKYQNPQKQKFDLLWEMLNFIIADSPFFKALKFKASCIEDEIEDAKIDEENVINTLSSAIYCIIKANLETFLKLYKQGKSIEEL